MAEAPDDGRPLLDPGLCQRVIGKRLLVGVTYVRYSGEVVRQAQFHGVVERITYEDGIVIRLNDGTIAALPPDLRGIEEAAPGVYSLRSTGEEVRDPDWLYAWTITQPDG